jgi:hypothetical protein
MYCHSGSTKKSARAETSKKSSLMDGMKPETRFSRGDRRGEVRLRTGKRFGGLVKISIFDVRT